MPLTHGVQQIEPVSGGIVVAGSRGNDWHYSTVALQQTPQVIDELVRRDAAPLQLLSSGRCVDVGLQPISDRQDCIEAAQELGLGVSGIHDESSAPDDPEGCFYVEDGSSKYIALGKNATRNAGAVESSWSVDEFDGREEVYSPARKPLCRHAWKTLGIFSGHAANRADVLAFPFIDVHVQRVANLSFVETLMKLNPSALDNQSMGLPTSAYSPQRSHVDPLW